MSGKRMILTLPWSSSSEELRRRMPADLAAKHKVSTGQNVFEQDRENDFVVEMMQRSTPQAHCENCPSVFQHHQRNTAPCGLTGRDRKALTGTIRAPPRCRRACSSSATR
jgi:hypothetical protein